jgi:hypothetical protein
VVIIARHNCKILTLFGGQNNDIFLPKREHDDDDDDDDDFFSPIGAPHRGSRDRTSVRTCVRVQKQSIMYLATLDWSAWPIKERKLWCPTNRSGYSTVLRNLYTGHSKRNKPRPLHYVTDRLSIIDVHLRKR